MDQGYVLRRLIRRAIREGRQLNVTGPFTSCIADVVIAEYGGVYPELTATAETIRTELAREEEQFARTLEHGLKEFTKLVGSIPAHVQNKIISGRKAFYLYETYGFPLELTTEMARENGFKVDADGFREAYQKHQELSRAGAEQKFKGGLADQSEKTAALHTATHLLHAALRQVLGPHVAQAGSNITADRLRFDFSHGDKMTPEQIAAVQEIVNAVIQRDLPITCREMPVDEARQLGAIGLFGEKYGAVVRVFTIGDFSMEICGGPHAEHTGQLGTFKVVKEESSSRGVRRIKAVLG